MSEPNSGNASADSTNQPLPVPPQFQLPLSQEALEAMPFPFAIYTRDGLYVGANALMEQLFHTPKSSVIGTFNLLTDPLTQEGESRTIFLAAVAGQHRQAPPVHYDFSFPGTHRPKRTGCWIEIRYLPFRDATGQVTHVGTITQDVSERVQAEHEAAMLKALVENANDGIGVTDLEGRLSYCNPAYQALTGYSADQLIGMRISDVHPDQPETTTTSIAEIRQYGQWRGMMWTRRADSTTFPTDVSAFLLRDRNGQPSNLAAILRDLTEQRAQEQRLRQVEVMVENAPDGFSYTELDGHLIYMNPTFRAMLGYDETPVGALLPEFFAPHEHPRIPGMIQVVMTQGQWQGPVSYRRTDGSLFNAHLSAFIIRDDHGAPIALAGIARDLTEQLRAEDERSTLQQQVIEAQQAALRELSTPLIPIADGIVAMPLIGSIDSSRAQLVIETLLNGTAELRAHTTIIDITGVPVVDTQIANALLRAAQAVKLLGSHVILTGIRPEVAQTLVGLGVDLQGISTRATLQSGIAEALGRGASATSGRQL